MPHDPPDRPVGPQAHEQQRLRERFPNSRPLPERPLPGNQGLAELSEIARRGALGLRMQPIQPSPQEAQVQRQKQQRQAQRAQRKAQQKERRAAKRLAGIATGLADKVITGAISAQGMMNPERLGAFVSGQEVDASEIVPVAAVPRAFSEVLAENNPGKPLTGFRLSDLDQPQMNLLRVMIRNNQLKGQQ